MLYLAITAKEFSYYTALPAKIAWMSCHFSSNNRGLSNRPHALPKDSVIIVDDQIPIGDHDPKTVSRQLLEMVEDFSPSGVLLDFQRPGAEEMVSQLVRALPCPTAVSERYADNLSCPVFLTPSSLCRPLKDQWPGREKWLDVPIGNQTVTVNKEGAHVSAWLPFEPIDGFFHEKLAVRYKLRCENEQVVFTLSRGVEELESFMRAGKNVGITRFFCIFREFAENIP